MIGHDEIALICQVQPRPVWIGH